MKKRVFRRWADDPASLRDLLVARLDITKEVAFELVRAGNVQVGTATASDFYAAVGVGTKVTVQLSAPIVAPPTVVVFRDDDLAVVDKPVGLASQPEPNQRANCLAASVTRDLGEGARVMHRLDKDASGLVVVALRKSAYAPLQHAIGGADFDRRYLAIARGNLTGDGSIRKRIGRHPRDQRLRAAFPENSTTGEPAVTRYRTLAHGTLGDEPVTALELQIETGRTHQIRVHLSSVDHPLVGDTAYGGPAYERLCLHAYALELPHPRTGRPLRVSVPPPDALTRLVPSLTRPFT
jgi:23S rRNA pseudouridine1911/1915/1917 synthase